MFDLCPDTGTEIVLVHVLDDDEDADPHSSSYKQSQAKLKRCEEDLRRAGYEHVDVLLPVGEAIEQINNLAEELNVDLTLLASHGKGFIRSTLLGSTTFDLARMAKYPLFIDKIYNEKNEHKPLLKNILVPTDFSKESLVALNVIRNLREHIEEVVFVHVIEKSRNADDLKEQMQKAEMKLNELADEVKIFGVRGTARVAKGTPSKQLQRIAVEIDASMIVIAKTGAGLVKGLPLGSTAQNLALNTNRPLLMLPDIDDI
ncbi:hypothetical protein SDC9_153918 [bioreactor metagenome]|uniref:UspA domain-containing protein n=1 Tax=bioreactor metagenome TaxID=1076179 RepID=A0A645EZI2_9ZZZZ